MRHDDPASATQAPRGNFNPRAYVRHDFVSRSSRRASRFQSTCLREARPGTPRSASGSPNFNPRAYVRHDHQMSEVLIRCVFQSTCLREARLPMIKTLETLLIFQSTCLREARLLTRLLPLRSSPFQSTCLREARHRVCLQCLMHSYFNPRAYVRHDM